MAPDRTALKALLRQQHWQTYGTFCKEWDKVAAELDPKLAGNGPSRTQFHRWLSGSLAGLPYSTHCRVLERMFPGWTAQQLFAPWTADTPPSPVGSPPARVAVTAEMPAGGTEHLVDLESVYTSRAEFNSVMPPQALFNAARDVRAAGLSLNTLFQHYSGRKLTGLLLDGARLQTLFLDPDGAAIKVREAEEHYAPGHLTALGNMNLTIARGIRDQLPPEAAERFEIRMYDECVRFNITLIDNSLCIVQPYLPDTRGVDSPTFVARNGLSPDGGLYQIFEQVYESVWNRGKPI